MLLRAGATPNAQHACRTPGQISFMLAQHINSVEVFNRMVTPSGEPVPRTGSVGTLGLRGWIGLR